MLLHDDEENVVDISDYKKDEWDLPW
jgi:hypothetical protein